MSRFYFILISASLLFIQCSQKPVGVSDNNDNTIQEQGQILFKMSMTGAPAEVVGLKGMLSREKSDTIWFKFEISDGYATAVVEDLIAGLWHLQVDALNGENVVIYTGRTPVQVLPGTVTPVNLHLNPTTGGLDIIVTWEETSIKDSLIVAYYPFENSLADRSFHQNHGIDRGDVSYTGGVHGQALQLDGFNDFVEIAHADYLNIEEKTVAFWFYKSNRTIRETPDWDDVEGLVYKSWDTGLNRDFSFTIRNQEPPFALVSNVWDGTDSLTFLRVEDIIEPQKWYFVTLVSMKNKAKLYLNTKLISEARFENDLIQNDAPIILGKASYKSYFMRHFNGLIDDLVIINKILNENEIEKIYKNDFALIR